MERTKALQIGVQKRVYFLKGPLLILFVITVFFLSLTYGGRVDAAGIGEPLASLTFGLEIEGVPVEYFAECTGIGSKNEVLEHRIVDGSGRESVQKIPGRLTWNNIVLKRGITSDLSMWQWRKQVEDGDIVHARKNISIVMYDQTMTPIAEWSLINGWLSNINTTVDADGSLMEEVLLVTEGETRIR